MTNAYLAPPPKARFVDNNGRPAINGTLSTFAAGTTTPIATYTDSTAATPNTNPITLNFRGECDLWLKPNIAYKLQLNDANGVLIWTVDQIVNSQLITLYGGVDTGAANAYILNFVANFTAYTDGIIIYWIPSNTNTAASTININGLGVINITNADGSALVAGEIIANIPATILIKGGAAILISSTSTAYGSFTCGWLGFSVAPTNTTINYRKNGTLVTLLMPQTAGTSNATTFIMNGLPTLLRPLTILGQNQPIIGLQDNGALVAGGLAVVQAAGVIQFYKDGTQPVWTAAGAKGFAAITALTYTI